MSKYADCGKAADTGMVVCRECWSEWISVKDRLPKYPRWYLVNIWGWVTLAWYGAKGWIDIHGGVAEPEEITHWMPLPKPPMEDECGRN